MQTIRLEYGEWTFDESDPLGPAGGFGEVFRGRGGDLEVAVKRLMISAGAAAHREMSIGSALAKRLNEHIVPVLDYGRDADGDRYYLIMPVCEHSLQDSLTRDGPLGLSAAKQAALDIIAGLMEVGDLVHRDLKPGNVLWHEGRWKIADFGIAKFVEDATSLESLRSSLTPLYAAPEQWRGERPSGATDVYALGCILYALMAGVPPFVGSVDDVREAHLHAPAPALTGVDPRLAGLVATMLRKSAGSRPSLERCEKVLVGLESASPSAGRAALAAAGHIVTQEEAAADAVRKARESAERERRDLASEAEADLRRIIDLLFDAIEAETDSARRERNAIILGPAHLTFEMSDASIGSLPAKGDDPLQSGWDVAANAYLTLRADRGASRNHPEYYKFGVSLVFARIGNDSEYRWREISFHEVFTNRSNDEQPFALNPFQHDFVVAVSNVMGKQQIAHGPLVIDGEDEGTFQDRWMRLFAKAAARRLAPPSRIPLSEEFFS